MRILEVRDGFIKLETSEKMTLSSFLEINDKGKKYIAQVIQCKNFNNAFIAFAKVLFIYDGTFNKLDDSMPECSAIVKEFSFDILNQYFKTESPIEIGTFAESEVKTYIDRDSFNRKMLVSIDNPLNLNKLLTNLGQEFSKENKVLVIDMLGIVDSSAKFKAAIDFKLPLNTESLEFIYEDCLSDATSDSKDLVKEIFADLAEYSKTVSFLPFKTLKSIIDDMVEKSHIFKLLVLKNKLTKFDKAGYFATYEDQALVLNRFLNNKTSVIDLSKLDNLFQNRYLSTIYNQLVESKYNGQVFVIASNAINKKNIRTILSSPQVASTFITHSRFKYLSEFKSLFTNYLLEANFSNNEIFKTYSTFLNKMDKDSYLLVGDSTKFIPVIIEFKTLTEISPFDDVINLEEDSDNTEALANTSLESLLENSEATDPQVEAIEKKSQDLVEKISIEDSTGNNKILDIFEEEKDDNLESQLEEEIIATEDNITGSFEEEADFHTQIDSFKATDINTESTDEIVETEIISIELEDSGTEELENEISESPINSEEVIENQEDIIEIPEDIEIIDDNLRSEDNTVPLETEENEQIVETVENSIEDTIEEYIETEVIPLNNDSEVIDEIIELNESDITEDAIIVDIEDPEEKALNDEIKEDVDKVFTTIKEETLSDTDLDFIDELNNENNNIEEVLLNEPSIEEDIMTSEDLESTDIETFEELEEYPSGDNSEEDFIEPLEEYNNNDSDLIFEENPSEILETKTATTPIVPVYSAEIPQEDLVMSDELEQGDSVIHAKYGTGVVEKMIKYGSKTLFSINFDNVGRRLLDPTLTEIKKA